MKLFRNILFSIFIMLFLNNCESSLLDLKPINKLSPDIVFSDPDGIEVFLANIYYNLPIEDFRYSCRSGFNWVGDNRGINDNVFVDDNIHPEGPNNILAGSGGQWWGFNFIRDVNLLRETIPSVDITDEEKALILAECHFFHAYAYYAMAKRYGGVPIIESTQEWTGDIETIKVPRNTERETWDYVMSECDKAIENLPEIHPLSPRR